MTSLVLFNSEPASSSGVIKLGVDWGTGKKRAGPFAEPSASHESGTFLYKGEPVEQNYRNTDITLSHVRINDELIPAALHTTDITPHQIPLEFPSNHPFSSHICEKSLFPNASTIADDHPSTDADPYVVTHKIRGNPYRREVHYQGVQRQPHRVSKWPDKQYMHLPRTLSDLTSSAIYPWPRKMFVPNDDSCLPTTGTHIVKNKEIARLETTYQGDYSNGEGLGSHVIYDTTAIRGPNDKLKPFLKKTLDPARPIDGVQAGHIHGNHRQPSALGPNKSSRLYASTDSIKIMSQEEKLDDQMRNGTDYVNLPAHMFTTERSATWIPRSESMDGSQQKEKPTENRFLHYLRPSRSVPQIARDHYASHQLIDAENRLEQLELIRPQDNINLLNLKLRSLQNPRHARPILPQYADPYVNTLYDQVGTYVQERSGLYHTNSYDPNTLVQAIPDIATAENPPDKETLLKDPTHLGDLLNSGEQTQNKSKPNLFQFKTFDDYQNMRQRLHHKLRVPTDASTVDARVQEGPKGFIQRESTYGQSFNTRKFLQENELVYHARDDPSCLMSTSYNSNLERVRSMNSLPIKPIANTSLTTTDDAHQENNDIVTVGPLLHPSPYDELYSTKHITEQSNGYSRRSVNRVYDSPFKTTDETTVFKFYERKPKKIPGYIQTTSQMPDAAKQIIRLPGPEVVPRFTEPKLLQHSTYDHSYKDVEYHEVVTPLEERPAHFNPLNLAMKDDDPRFGRMADGRVKQWKLIDLQDRWTKTKAQRNYHSNHPEPVPYVGEGTMRAKKEILIADGIEQHRMLTVL